MFKGSRDDTTLNLMVLYRLGQQYARTFGYSPDNLMPDVIAEYARETVAGANGYSISYFVQGAQQFRNPAYKRIQQLATYYACKQFKHFYDASDAWTQAVSYETYLIHLVADLDETEREKVKNTFVNAYRQICG